MFEDQDGHFKVQRLHVRGAIREWLEKSIVAKKKNAYEQRSLALIIRQNLDENWIR